MDIRHRNGAVAELFTAAKIAENGWNILYPLVTQSRYDIVIEKEGVFCKIQIKKATWSKSNTYKYLQARISGKNKQTNTPYKKSDVDYFAFTDMQRVWLFPFDVIGHQTSVCLDSTNPKYKPKTEYTANEWLIK